ncbi:exonuclease domain-containing protein [Thioclava sp. 'Guangxiensis']|uniref:3'-5' exonuclease n=1 Tax=Thioclava sp. 'Guangxiensis' TaxID=3149044 RepID=UPI0038780379
MEAWGARLGLRLRVFLLFAALAVGLVLALLAGAWLGGRQGQERLVVMALVSGLLGVTLVAGLWLLFDEHVARPIEALAGAMRLAGWGDSAAFDAPYLGDLGPAGAALGEAMSAQNTRMAREVEQALAQAATSQARLEVLLADMPVAVLLLSRDLRVVLYNPQAAALLVAGEARPGLGRNLADFVELAPILHAIDRLSHEEDPEARSDLLCTTHAGQVLTGHLRCLPGSGAEGGHVLTLQDVSAQSSASRAAMALNAEILATITPAIAALHSLLDTLTDPQGPQGEDRSRVRMAAQAQVRSLTRDLHRLGQQAERIPDWTMAEIRASDLAEAVRARIGRPLTLATSSLILRADAEALLDLWGRIVPAVDRDGRGEFRLEITAEGAGALMALEWQGAPLPFAQLDALLGPSERQVLDRHRSDIWPETLHDGRARLCLPLRDLAPAADRPDRYPRRVTYDFDLLDRQPPGDIRLTPLEQLTYVVFDTETTGLDPETDAIVQIAAQRIVNGRVCETFEMLVNPDRPIPASAQAIHGISDEMVATAPTAAIAIGRFHHFARDAVLVAHNAPFDIGLLRAALRRHPQPLTFEHPVLDTVLLSAILFGQSQSHTLDALCDRLGILIPPEARHSAMGDTDATARAFLRMLPALKSKGLHRLADLIIAARKHGRLIRDLNL